MPKKPPKICNAEEVTSINLYIETSTKKILIKSTRNRE